MTTPSSGYHSYRSYEGNALGQQLSRAGPINSGISIGASFPLVSSSVTGPSSFATSMLTPGNSNANPVSSTFAGIGNNSSIVANNFHNNPRAHYHHHEAQVRGVQRLNQLREEQSHKAVVDQKMKDLLSNKLDVLRRYVNEVIEADNWKYEKRK